VVVWNKEQELDTILKKQINAEHDQTTLFAILVYCRKRESREYRMRVEGAASSS